MSDRLREAREACEQARAMSKTLDTHAEPDLFAAWEQPTSPPDGWIDAALEVVKRAARARPTLTIEDIRPDVPPTVDYRALGALMTRAARAGWIVADGWVSGNAEQRHNRPIRLWASRIYREGA